MPSALFVALVLISFLPQVAGAAGTLFSAQGLPDCAEHEDFATSTYGMLQTALLPTNISSPEQDARVNFANGDYRLLADEKVLLTFFIKRNQNSPNSNYSQIQRLTVVKFADTSMCRTQAAEKQSFSAAC